MAQDSDEVLVCEKLDMIYASSARPICVCSYQSNSKFHELALPLDRILTVRQVFGHNPAQPLFTRFSAFAENGKQTRPKTKKPRRGEAFDEAVKV